MAKTMTLSTIHLDFGKPRQFVGSIAVADDQVESTIEAWRTIYADDLATITVFDRKTGVTTLVVEGPAISRA